MARLDIRVLGTPGITVDGRPVSLSGRPLVLLVRLAVAEGRPVSSSQLVDDVWGPDTDDSGVLRVTLTRLRQRLGPDAIERVEGGYALVEPHLDARRAEALVRRARDRGIALHRRISIYDETIGLWTGAAFSGLHGIAWIESEAARLDELREQAVDECFELRALVEPPERLIPELTAILADQPLRTRRVGLLATALYRTGRHPDALRVIDRSREQLREQLGLDPTPELLALEHQILVQDPSLAANLLDTRAEVHLEVEGLLRAARSLTRHGAYPEALELIDEAEEMAVSADDRRAQAQVLLLRALHSSMSGRDDPYPLLRQARALARELRDGPLLARIAVAGFGQGASTDLRRGYTELLEPLELLPRTAREQVDLLCAAATMVAVGPRSGADDTLLAAATEVARIDGTPRTAAVLDAARCIVAANAGRPSLDAEQGTMEALRHGQETDDPVLVLVATHGLIRSRYLRADLDGVDEVLDALHWAGRRSLTPFAIARVGICRAMNAVARGQLDLAVSLVDELEGTGRQLRTLNTPDAVAAQRALLFVELDRAAELVPSLNERLEAGWPYRDLGLALLALADDTVPGPLELLDSSDLTVPEGGTRLAFFAITALVALARDDVELAQACIPELEACGDIVVAIGLGSVLFGFAPQLTGDLKRLVGDLDGAVDDLERALTLLEPTGAQLWLDHTRTALADTLARRGDLERARDLAALVASGPVVGQSHRLAGRLDRLRATLDSADVAPV